jgi:hypothetical protein
MTLRLCLPFPGVASVVVVYALGMSTAACEQPLTSEEVSFYERAEGFKVGAALENVKQELGEPSRVVEAGTECRTRGGRREWVYESFQAGGGRKPLRAGTFAFCTDQREVVVAIFWVVT